MPNNYARPVLVDFCPVHNSLFDPNDRIDCHSRQAYLRGESFMPSDARRLECEWWQGELVDLWKTYPQLDAHPEQYPPEVAAALLG